MLDSRRGCFFLLFFFGPASPEGCRVSPPLPQGDVWICMELMDTSLDKFYKMVIEKGLPFPEDILGKIAVSVSPRHVRLVGERPSVRSSVRPLTAVCVCRS